MWLKDKRFLCLTPTFNPFSAPGMIHISYFKASFTLLGNKPSLFSSSLHKCIRIRHCCSFFLLCIFEAACKVQGSRMLETACARGGSCVGVIPDKPHAGMTPQHTVGIHSVVPCGTFFFLPFVISPSNYRRC